MTMGDVTTKPEVATSEISKDATKLQEISIVDTRNRHEGLLQLIYNRDRKAVQFIQIYIAFIGAIVSLVVLKVDGTTLAHKVVAAFSFFVVVLLVIGILFAIKAQYTADLFCTGQKAEFWLWGIDEKVTADDIVAEYLKRSQENFEHNDKINDETSDAIQRTFKCGVAAIILGIVGFVIVVLTLLAKS